MQMGKIPLENQFDCVEATAVWSNNPFLFFVKSSEHFKQANNKLAMLMILAVYAVPKQQ